MEQSVKKEVKCNPLHAYSVECGLKMFSNCCCTLERAVGMKYV